jgi:hypothetical protein
VALSQQALANFDGQEAVCAELPGMPVEPNRRDQRRQSSVLSAASSVARHYEAMDDDVEMHQEGL